MGRSRHTEGHWRIALVARCQRHSMLDCEVPAQENSYNLGEVLELGTVAYSVHLEAHCEAPYMKG